MKREKSRPPRALQLGDIEVIDVIEDWFNGLDFCAGNVVKYVGRYKHKENPVEDLKKAKWYLDRMIEKLTKEEK